MRPSANGSEADGGQGVIAGKKWWPFGIGLLAVYALFEVSARMLGSDRGQFGWAVATLVVCATLLAERYLSGESFADGVGPFALPARRGIRSLKE